MTLVWGELETPEALMFCGGVSWGSVIVLDVLLPVLWASLALPALKRACTVPHEPAQFPMGQKRQDNLWKIYYVLPQYNISLSLQIILALLITPGLLLNSPYMHCYCWSFQGSFCIFQVLLKFWANAYLAEWLLLKSHRSMRSSLFPIHNNWQTQ